MHRTEPRVYALPFPAVFDAVVTVLGDGGPVTVADRAQGRVVQARRLHRVTAYVGSVSTTRTTVVIDIGGLLGTRRRIARVQSALDQYLRYWFRPSA
jgi:hypothetical protein